MMTITKVFVREQHVNIKLMDEHQVEYKVSYAKDYSGGAYSAGMFDKENIAALKQTLLNHKMWLELNFGLDIFKIPHLGMEKFANQLLWTVE